MKDYTDLLGCKFKVHGRNKVEGFDCYGLAMEVLRREGIKLPDIPYNQIDHAESILEDIWSTCNFEKVDRPTKNCLIEIEYRNLPMHVAVYIGNGKMIHSVIGYGVRIEPIHLWEKRIKGYYKVSKNC